MNDIRKELKQLSASAPPIEKQIAELKAAGWVKVLRYTWKAPTGGYFMGPHGAWVAMKRREAREHKQGRFTTDN